MKRILFVAAASIMLMNLTFNFFGQDKEKKIIYYVIPVENNKKDTKFYPLLDQPGKEKVLYYVEPMDKKIKSYFPKKDDMGMDYIPVYVDETSRKLVYYVSPMDVSIKSDKPKKDDMGMDFIPVYEAKVFSK